MLNIVLDTNMYLSAFLYGGMVEVITDCVVDNKLGLRISPELTHEVIRKLQEYGASEPLILMVSRFIEYKAVSVKPTVTVKACRDPKDNFVLELAQTSHADYIITRDKDLLELKNQEWKKTKIMRPEEFLPLLRNKKLIND